MHATSSTLPHARCPMHATAAHPRLEENDLSTDRIHGRGAMKAQARMLRKQKTSFLQRKVPMPRGGHAVWRAACL
eukprot:1146796-Pelagomonas_calceolata.AAC.2